MKVRCIKDTGWFCFLSESDLKKGLSNFPKGPSFDEVVTVNGSYTRNGFEFYNLDEYPLNEYEIRGFLSDGFKPIEKIKEKASIN